jgi:hypothetical protein
MHKQLEKQVCMWGVKSSGTGDRVGQVLLAGGEYTAYTYEEDFSLGSDGLLSIYFAAIKGQAAVAGIEIKVPAVLRIDAGSTSTFQDELTPQPHVWQADNYFTGSASGHL